MSVVVVLNKISLWFTFTAAFFASLTPDKCHCHPHTCIYFLASTFLRSSTTICSYIVSNQRQRSTDAQICGSRFELVGYPPPPMGTPNIQWTTTSISAVPWTWPLMEVSQMQQTAASMQSIASYQQNSHSWPNCLKSTIPVSLTSKSDLYNNYGGY